MSRRFELTDYDEFKGIDLKAWEAAQKREKDYKDRKELLLHGWSREEWLSYAYHLITQRILLEEIDVSTLDEKELVELIEEMKTMCKHVMTMPSRRDYFGKNVSA